MMCMYVCVCVSVCILQNTEYRYKIESEAGEYARARMCKCNTYTLHALSRADIECAIYFYVSPSYRARHLALSFLRPYNRHIQQTLHYIVKSIKRPAARRGPRLDQQQNAQGETLSFDVYYRYLSMSHFYFEFFFFTCFSLPFSLSLPPTLSSRIYFKFPFLTKPSP